MHASIIPMVAGIASTVIFAGSTLPMLAKARRTHDLASYSLGNIMLANMGNVVHSAYVFSLPPGPIWVLHTFYLLSSGTMLVWFLRFGPQCGSASSHSGQTVEVRRKGVGNVGRQATGVHENPHLRHGADA